MAEPRFRDAGAHSPAWLHDTEEDEEFAPRLQDLQSEDDVEDDEAAAAELDLDDDLRPRVVRRGGANFYDALDSIEDMNEDARWLGRRAAAKGDVNPGG
jgi:hypothetical protein